MIWEQQFRRMEPKSVNLAQPPNLTHRLTPSPKTLLSNANTYSLDLSPCSSAAAVSAPSAASPAPAPCGGSPSSSGAPVAPADASMPGVPVAAADEGIQQSVVIKIINNQTLTVVAPILQQFAEATA